MNQYPYGFANLPPPSPYAPAPPNASGFANLPPPSPYAPPPMQPAPPPPATPPGQATLSATPPPPPSPGLPANSPYGGVASSAAAGGLTAETPGETISDTLGPKDPTAGDKFAKGVGGAVSDLGSSMQKTAQAGQQDAFSMVFHSSPLALSQTTGPIAPIGMSDRRAKVQISPAATQLRSFLESWRRR